MAHMVIITHTFDAFTSRRYLMREMAEHWRNDGHRVTVVEGLEDWPDADVAVLHVDHSLVPEAYLQQARQRYPRLVNGNAVDIRKRLVSHQLVTRDDAWNGPVIIKTNLNRGGASEMRYLKLMHEAGRQPEIDSQGMVFSQQPYPMLQTKAEVNPAIWTTPGVVVEKFLPERDERGYWLRWWTFLGRQERCLRALGTQPLVRSGAVTDHELVEVPPELRAERERLGFDYGNFDFVIHDGRVVFLDATRTPLPGSHSIYPAVVEQNRVLARGIFDWLDR
jgi:hypothetical protein